MQMDPFLKAYMKILPLNLLPKARFDISNSEFFNYIDCKIPEIDVSEIQNNLVSCPQPILKLDIYEALPILIEKAGVKEAMTAMNKLFPHRKVWNMNIIDACSKFEKKIS